jgi:dihydrofolate synthase/folylpolyglutamate synthase
LRVLGATTDGRLRAAFETAQDVYEVNPLALRGRHQLTNAAVAIALAEELRVHGFNIPRDAIIAGLHTAAHPGRLELRPGAPPLLFDGAHNPAGAEALRAYLDEFVRAPVTLVFGAMGDKELGPVAAALFPAARRLVLTRPNNPRAATLDVLTGLAQQHADAAMIERAETSSAALSRAYELTPPKGLICVTGSLYLVGEVQELSRRTSL